MSSTNLLTAEWFTIGIKHNPDSEDYASPVGSCDHVGVFTLNCLSLQAVWALGNIAGDSPKCRDFVLGHNALPSLLEQMKEDSKISMLRNATWTLSNFCRGKPSPSFVTVSGCQVYLTSLALRAIFAD